MDEEQELEIVDLGDAKEQTRGMPVGVIAESNPIASYRPED